MADRAWRATYEELRSEVLAGVPIDGANARRLARFGLVGLQTARPAWQVVVSQAPEPRWSGGDPRAASLARAFAILQGAPR